MLIQAEIQLNYPPPFNSEMILDEFLNEGKPPDPTETPTEVNPDPFDDPLYIFGNRGPPTPLPFVQEPIPVQFDDDTAATELMSNDSSREDDDDSLPNLAHRPVDDEESRGESGECWCTPCNPPLIINTPIDQDAMYEEMSDDEWENEGADPQPTTVHDVNSRDPSIATEQGGGGNAHQKTRVCTRVHGNLHGIDT